MHPFSWFLGCVFRNYVSRSFLCKNRIKIVVFAFAMIAARTMIWSDRRCLMISRLGGCWVLLWCLLGASGGRLGVSWVFPGWSLGASWLTAGCSWVHSGCGLGAPGLDLRLLGAALVPDGCFRESLGCLLGVSWVVPWCFLAGSWSLLGAFWARPGCSWPRFRLLGHPPHDIIRF